jgi:hypothetical protein
LLKTHLNCVTGNAAGESNAGKPWKVRNEQWVSDELPKSSIILKDFQLDSTTKSIKRIESGYNM